MTRIIEGQLGLFDLLPTGLVCSTLRPDRHADLPTALADAGLTPLQVWDHVEAIAADAGWHAPDPDCPECLIGIDLGVWLHYTGTADPFTPVLLHLDVQELDSYDLLVVDGLDLDDLTRLDLDHNGRPDDLGVAA
jgi:hypothetical protein